MIGGRGAVVLVTAPVAFLLALVSMSVVVLSMPAADTANTQTACGGNGPSVSVAAGTLPSGPLGAQGWRGVQLENAAFIINAGQLLDIGVRGQTIGVMTAMGESSLIVKDRGDKAGPDSRGLFQQRDNGAWGTEADRMDPHISSTNFFLALLDVAGWEDMPPSAAAHKVQRNSDPYHYEPHWDDAVVVVQALAAVEVTSVAVGSGSQSCAMTPGVITADGWTLPAAGGISSPYGMRVHPLSGSQRMHWGTDIGAPMDAPIYAAADGVITRAGPSSGYGNLIVVDHGGGVVSRYAHMYQHGILVTNHDSVSAGQQIALVGSAGGSTGAHLHFEIKINDAFTDPQPFMAARGVILGGGGA